MTYFAELIEALQSGKKVRHSRWANTTKAFIQNNQFVIQCGVKTPHNYDLSWQELTEKKWSVL